MKMKHFIVFVVIAAFFSIGYGFTLKAENETLANKYIGFGTLGLFFVAMPLFLYKESKGKKNEGLHAKRRKHHENAGKREKRSGAVTFNQAP